ncbi:MAG: hypothetical protein NW226_00090 [Microscillaceae bacterium]|nr:hypothetical protein [Microscillaceae bacterium]
MNYRQKFTYERADYQHKTDSLRSLFGFRKKIPEEYELQTLLAISHYPDLYRARIKFKYVDRPAIPISARPSFVDFVHSRKNRQYKIVMRVGSPYVLNRNFDEQVGLIGHELGHIQFYIHKSFLSLIGVGFKYATSDKYRMRFELDTDRRLIDYGLGWQLREAPIYLDRSAVEDYMKQVGYMF